VEENPAFVLAGTRRGIVSALFRVASDPIAVAALGMPTDARQGSDQTHAGISASCYGAPMQSRCSVPRKYSLLLACVVGVSACGSDGSSSSQTSSSPSVVATGASESTSTSTTVPELRAWSLGDATASPLPTEDDLDAPADAPEDADLTDHYVFDVLGPEGDPPSDSTPGLPPIDPCTLVTTSEWATWAGVVESATSTMSLEYGTACGYLVADDSVRLALAVIEPGDPWFANESYDSDVAVGGLTGKWAAGYPLDESSTLVVALPGGSQLVIELSSRGSWNDDQLRDGAVQFATSALAQLGVS